MDLEADHRVDLEADLKTVREEGSAETEEEEADSEVEVEDDCDCLLDQAINLYFTFN